MSLFVLNVVLWALGIRGHIPRDDGPLPAGRSGSSLAGDTGALMRVLAVAVVAIGLLSLLLWAAVWLAIKVL